MKPIYLGRSGKHVTWVDDRDYDWLSQWNWTLRGNYAGRRSKDEGDIFMHRVITDCPEDKVVDHINGDTLLNIRQNLRVCTQKENSRNSKIYKNNNSGYIGVSRMSQLDRWRARVHVDGRELFLGSYSDARDAAKAYNAGAIRYFGDYARLNDVDGSISDWESVLTEGLKDYTPLVKSSSFTGVSFCKSTGRWRSYVTIDGQSIRIGRYDSELEGAYVADQLKIQLYPK